MPGTRPGDRRNRTGPCQGCPAARGPWRRGPLVRDRRGSSGTGSAQNQGGVEFLEEVSVPNRTAIPVTLNGKPREIASDQTVAGLLEELELRERLVVVE